MRMAGLVELTAPAIKCFFDYASRARADALANLLLPSKVAPRKRDVVGAPATKRDPTTCVSPPRCEPMEGFYMSTKKQAPRTDPEFFPENVEFHGVIGGWGYDFGLDTYDALF